MNWQELLNKMAGWQRAQFKKANTQSAWSHLARELVELGNNLDDAEEWADVLHLAIQGGTKAAGSLNKFKSVVEAKLLKNMSDRDWPDKPDADNVYEHVKPKPLGFFGTDAGFFGTDADPHT